MSSTQDNSQEMTSGRSTKPKGQDEIEKRSSRRTLLQQVITAATAVGAGILLRPHSDMAHAASPDNPGNFSSSRSLPPAVTATGTNGAIGVDATSDFAAGVAGRSNGEQVGGVVGQNTSNAGYGVLGRADTGTAVWADTTSGIALHATGGPTGIAVQAIGGSVALNVQGIVQIQGNAVGQATLPAGKKTSVTVTTSAATTSSNILLTPLGNPNGNLWVTRAAGSFTIHASTAPKTALSIAYLIIN